MGFVNIPTGLAINTSTPADRTTAAGMRKVLGALFRQSTPGAPVPGIIPSVAGTPLDVLPSASAMEYVVKAGYAVTTRTGQGAYLVGTDTDVTVTTDAANVTNPRIDIIYIYQPDPELADSGKARIEVAVGSPSASPVAPSIPTGALELGRKLVPAGAANTSTGTAISNKAAQTSLAVTWASIPDKPTTFTPATHTHTAAQITDPTNLDVGKIRGQRIYVIEDGDPNPSPLSVGDVVIKYTPAP